MYRTLTSSLLIAAVASLSGCGLINSAALTAPSSGRGATAADIDNFLRDAAMANNVVNRAAWLLTLAVVSKEEAAALRDKRKAIEGIEDPKEKEAKLSRFEEDNLAALEKRDMEAAAKRAEQAQNAKKNAAVKGSIWNLGWGVIADASLLATGKKLVGGVPHPSVAAKLSEVKTSMQLLGRQATSLKTVIGKSKALMRVVKLDKLPTSMSEEPTDVSDDF